MAKKPKPCNRPLTIVLVLCLLSAILCLGATGCNQTPAQRVTEVKAVVDRANALNLALDTSITEIEGVIQTSQAMLLDPNVPDSMKLPIQQTLTAAQTRLTQLRQQKTKIDISLAQWQAIINQTATEGNNVGLEQEIKTYAAMVNSTSSYLPPPYNGYVYLGSALAMVLAGLIANIVKNTKLNQQINAGKAALTNLVTSVDAVLDPQNGVIPVEKVGQAKIVLQQNQAGATQDVIDAIHDPMQNTAPK
jgi:hypothetical protein